MVSLAWFAHTWNLAERVNVAMGVRRNFSRWSKVDILLIILRLLTLQCKWTFTKRFPVSIPQRKFPMKARTPFASILKYFSSGAVGRLYEFVTKVYFQSSVTLLKWRINDVIIVNSTQMNLKCTWTINNYVFGSLICLCWLNRTHFWNLLSELFSALRLSEMLFLFINCLVSVLRALSTNKSKLRTMDRPNQD